VLLAWLFFGVDLKILIINGLVTGAVYAIAASGLVVTYSTSGIFNFAHGALGMFCAYIYWDLRVNKHLPAPIALALVLLVIAPAIGAFLYRAIIRGLEGTSEIVKLVVPISVLLALIGAANWIWKTDKPHTLQPFFGGSKTVTFFDVVLTYHDITVVAISIGLALALRILLYQTRSGVAMRASVDDRSLLQLNGGRPDRASLLSWMIGVSLSALAGILITPFQGGSLAANLLTLLVINAFAAAMFGRLRSLPLTYLGAIVLGIATRAAFEKPTGFFPKAWDWRGNFRLAVPMILLFVILLVLPQDRLRGAVVARSRERFRLPTLQQSAISGAALVFTVFLLTRIMSDTAVITLGNGVASAIIILSLVLLVGYAGEASLATMAFAAIGGITFFHHVPHELNSRAGLGAYAIAIVVTAVVGAVVALPALRLRGLYLALATAAFSVGVEYMVMKELNKSRRIYPLVLTVIAVAAVSATYSAYRAYRARGAAIAAVVGSAALAIAATNGWLKDEQWSPIFSGGNLTIPRPEFFGIDFKPQRNYLLLLTTVFSLVGLLLIVLRRSSYGRRLSAMKDSPAACATLGMNVVRLKLSVFMLSAGIAGLGGCLYGGQIGALAADRFSLFESMAMFMLVVVAGVGYVSGGFVAGLLHAAVFIVLQNILTKLGQDYSAFGHEFKWLASLSPFMSALIGIGLGRNPTGFFNDFFVNFKPMVDKVKPVLFGGLAVELGAWYLAFEKHIGNWTFAIVTMVLILFLPRVAEAVNPGAFGKTARADAAASTPLELIGIDRPWTPADLRGLDDALFAGIPAAADLDLAAKEQV
jgi:branched-chain amino acid transport system permease protein